MKPAALLLPSQLVTIEQQLTTWLKMRPFLRVTAEELTWDPNNKVSQVSPSFSQFQQYYGLGLNICNTLN